MSDAAIATPSPEAETLPAARAAWSAPRWRVHDAGAAESGLLANPEGPISTS